MGSKEAVILKGDLVALAPAAELTVDLAMPPAIRASTPATPDQADAIEAM